MEEFSRLPGIGKKTALRLVLHLLKQDPASVERFAKTLERLHQEVVYCKQCCNLSDHPVCHICASPRRDASMVCIVEDIRDVIAIENTGQYLGRYHVLGGIISPMDGIGPSDLNIDSLNNRLKNNGEVKEVILALSTTMEGDTTSFYLYKILQPFDLKVSVIARGIAIGDELEYADEVTLGRSILHRTEYDTSNIK